MKNVAMELTNCYSSILRSDVRPDGVWIGEKMPITCVRPGWGESAQICKDRGCFWRHFHCLKDGQHVRAPEQKELIK